MKRKMLALIMVGLISFGLVGCTKTVTTTTTENGVTTTTTEVEDENGTTVTTETTAEDEDDADFEDESDFEEEIDFEEADYEESDEEYITLQDYYSIDENYDMFDSNLGDLYEAYKDTYSEMSWEVSGNDFSYSYTFANPVGDIAEAEDAIVEKFASYSDEQIEYDVFYDVVGDANVTGLVTVDYCYYDSDGTKICNYTFEREYQGDIQLINGNRSMETAPILIIIELSGYKQFTLSLNS